MEDAKVDRFTDYIEAFAFLDGHPIFQYKGKSHFLECYVAEKINVNPETGEIDADVSKNTSVQIRLRCGEWLHPGRLMHGRDEYPNGVCSPDYKLTCVAPTSEEAMQ